MVTLSSMMSPFSTHLDNKLQFSIVYLSSLVLDKQLHSPAQVDVVSSLSINQNILMIDVFYSQERAHVSLFFFVNMICHRVRSSSMVDQSTTSISNNFDKILASSVKNLYVLILPTGCLHRSLASALDSVQSEYL